MDRKIFEAGFQVQRSRQDRRVTPYAAAPYLTGEGFVLCDRREGGDRRARAAAQAQSGGESAPPQELRHMQ